MKRFVPFALVGLGALVVLALGATSLTSTGDPEYLSLTIDDMTGTQTWSNGSSRISGVILGASFAHTNSVSRTSQIQVVRGAYTNDIFSATYTDDDVRWSDSGGFHIQQADLVIFTGDATVNQATLLIGLGKERPR